MVFGLGGKKPAGAQPATAVPSSPTPAAPVAPAATAQPPPAPPPPSAPAPAPTAKAAPTVASFFGGAKKQESAVPAAEVPASAVLPAPTPVATNAPVAPRPLPPGALPPAAPAPTPSAASASAHSTTTTSTTRPAGATAALGATATDPWASLDAQRATHSSAAAAAAATPAVAAASPAPRTVGFESTAAAAAADAAAQPLAAPTARPRSASASRPTSPGARPRSASSPRPPSPAPMPRTGAGGLVENRPVRKVLDHPLRPSAPAYPFAGGRRVFGGVGGRGALAAEAAVLDLAPWDRPATAGSARRPGWSAFGAQAVSHRATAAVVAFERAPRVAAWVREAEARALEPGPGRYGSGLMRHKALAAAGAGAARAGSAGSARARRHDSLPAGHFRHYAREGAAGEGAGAHGGAAAEAAYEYVPYPLLHVRPVKGGAHGRAGGAGARTPSGVVGSTFGTARRQTAFSATPAIGIGARTRGAEGPRPYYVPMTR